MRVLAAVFPHAGRISLDVAHVGGGFVERRSEEQDQIVGFTHEVFLEGSQSDLDATGVAGAGNRSPGLRKRIDACFGVFLGSKRGTIVKVCAAIPRSVPSLRVDRLCELGGAVAAGLRFLAQLAQGEQLSEISKHTNLKPSEPDALSFAAQSDAIEAVIPIASSDQRQSVRTSGGGAREGTPAMFEQRTLRDGGDRNGKALCLFGLEWFGFEERDHLIEDRGVPGRADVMRGCKGKPEKIVTDPGAHPSA